jgi:hypothetical protein
MAVPVISTENKEITSCKIDERTPKVQKDQNFFRNQERPRKPPQVTPRSGLISV